MTAFTGLLAATLASGTAYQAFLKPRSRPALCCHQVPHPQRNCRLQHAADAASHASAAVRSAACCDYCSLLEAVSTAKKLSMPT